jgi:hypothetical protein
MRALHVYLAVYYVLLGSAFVVLWQSGILSELPFVWVLAFASIAVVLGVLLALVSRSEASKEDV